MTRIIKKKTLFLFSIIFTGIISLLGSYLRVNYLKNDSLIVPKAKADVTTCGWCGCPYTDDQCTTYYGCFSAGTAISTPTGDKEIQNLAVGDMVYGFHAETGQIGEYPITQTFKHEKSDPDFIPSPLLKITHEKGELLVTENHWIYRRNERVGEYAHFDRAGMLQVGDKLTMEDGKEVAVVTVEKGPEYDAVYNLEVADVHTYIAGGVRVHNSGAGGCCGSSGK